MLQFPDIDPVIFKIGPLSMRWYGLMYILGFASSYLLVMYQLKKKTFKIDRAIIDDLFFYLILGLIVGARLGYVIFYNPGFYLQNPLDIFVIWRGGMSFHGGLIGTFIVGYIIITRKKLNFFATIDLIIPTCPIGIGFGRLGNFINGELFGKPTGVPWAMVFPEGGPSPRHPSQLYEMKKRDGDVFSLFLILYGLFRIFCELFREPDSQLGYIFGLISMGQILSLCMIAIGIVLKYFYLPKTAARA
jgi:phosphatidylglycerol:prolipoprotein diacylglycerol transferase